MITILKVKFDFLRFSFANFILRANHIKSMLSGNANFSSPPILITDLENAINSFKQSVELYEDKPSLKGEVEQKRQVLGNMLVVLGMYVQSCNNRAKINTSGYELHSPKTPVSDVSVSNLKAKTSGMPGVGTVFLQWKKSSPVLRSCMVQHTAGIPTAESIWDDIFSTGKSKCQVTVETGIHSFRIIVLSSRGASEPCQPVSIVVG